MQLRSGTLITSPACDIPPSFRKRKPSFQIFPSKRRKPTKDLERNGHEGILPQQKLNVYHSSKSTDSHFHLKSLSPPATQGNEHPANSLSQNEKYSTTDEKPHLKRAPLTIRNLKFHSRSDMGRRRKDPLTALSKNATTTEETTAETTAKTTTNTTINSTMDKAFGIQLHKNGIIYGRHDAEEPEDITMVKEYLDRARDSSDSPDQKAYNQYVKQVGCGENELSVEANVWPILAQHPTNTDRQDYIACYNLQWTEVESPLTVGLTDAKPDISESYRRNQYPPDAFDALGGALAPTQCKLAMPTFCAEWKGPSGNMTSAEMQCAYDGALMVDAAYETHKHMNKNPAEFFGKTQALTVGLNNESVHVYGNHVVKKGSGLEYHQYPLETHNPGTSLENFKETYKHLRNAQDWAQERAGRTKDDLHAYTRAKEVAPTILPESIDKPKAAKKKRLRSAKHDKR